MCPLKVAFQIKSCLLITNTTEQRGGHVCMWRVTVMFKPRKIHHQAAKLCWAKSQDPCMRYLERFILKSSQYCKYHETESGTKLRPPTQEGGEISP